MSERYPIGEFVPLIWDGCGDPPAYYVSGHVTDAEFRAALIAFHGEGFDIPADAKIEHSHVRTVRAAAESDFDHEWRECPKGRGARPVTVWTLAPHRGNGG